MRPAHKLLALLLLLPITVAANAQDWAKTRLNASPRHSEMVTLHHGSRSLKAFVVSSRSQKQGHRHHSHPRDLRPLRLGQRDGRRTGRHPATIVIAPDLLSGSGPNGAGSEAFPTPPAAMPAVSALPDDQVMADLNAAADYG